MVDDTITVLFPTLLSAEKEEGVHMMLLVILGEFYGEWEQSRMYKGRRMTERKQILYRLQQQSNSYRVTHDTAGDALHDYC